MSGVLERAMPLDQVDPEEVETTTPADQDKGRGLAPKKPRPAKRVTGRTIYIPDDVWERIIVQSHRRNRTMSEYVVSILERQVPDHRVVRGSEESAA